MARWTTRERQKFVDEYLNATGRNQFVPREALDWLKPQKKHPLWSVFFERSDADWAADAREDAMRRWVSGLRVTVTYSDPKSQSVSVVTVQQPLYVSPTSGRRSGGGYLSNDGHDASLQEELRRQAATALDAWLNRYGGVTEAAGIDLSPMREIAAHLAGGVVQSAA